MLYGRAAEIAEIDRILADALAARGTTLVIRGDTGIGKSALLDHAAEQAAGIRTLRITSIPAETELAYAGIHLLLHPFADRIGALPPPQADALRSALGTGDSAASDRFLVGLAVLAVLAGLAERGPVICLIDDAHWMDRASVDALLFAARRFETERIALIFTTRDSPRVLHAPGLPELRLDALSREAAAELLAGHAGDVAARVRDRIIEEAGGNPLALLELPAVLTPGQRAGRPRSPAFDIGPLPDSARLNRVFGDRIDALPEAARTLLLVASADGTGDLGTVLGAARRLGASLCDLEPAERHGLLGLHEGRLRFGHPLVRAAVYGRAAIARRHAAHHALADALDGAIDTDRRAWHLAAATVVPEEKVAAALESGAERARHRGGIAAIAAARERAAALSPDPDRRRRRLTAAAWAALDAGQPDWAADLAGQAGSGGSRIRALMALERGRHEAARDLLIGTVPEAPTIFEAMTTAWVTGDGDLADALAARLPVTPRTRHLLRGASGLMHLLADEPDKGIPAVREMIAGTRAGIGLRERASVGAWTFLVGDLEASCDLAVALERDCRTGGAIGLLPRTLLWLARTQLALGLHRAAKDSATEGPRIAGETSQHLHGAFLSAFLAYLAAIEGDAERCRALAEGTTDLAAPWGEYALSLVDLCAARHEEARRRLRCVSDGHATVFAIPDLVECAAFLGRPETVAEPARRFQAWAGQVDQPWAEALALRCRALLATESADVEAHYLAAARLHAKGCRPFERARTELLFGEWLRRNRRRSEARYRLRSALDLFQRLGATPWAERARAELRTSGQSQAADGRGADPLGRLTPQELQVVRLAAEGLSNRDIAARMFLSPRTVGYYLYTAYPKLGVASRRELPHLLNGR